MLLASSPPREARLHLPRLGPAPHAVERPRCPRALRARGFLCRTFPIEAVGGELGGYCAPSSVRDVLLRRERAGRRSRGQARGGGGEPRYLLCQFGFDSQILSARLSDPNYAGLN